MVISISSMIYLKISLKIGSYSFGGIVDGVPPPINRVSIVSIFFNSSFRDVYNAFIYS